MARTAVIEKNSEFIPRVRNQTNKVMMIVNKALDDILERAKEILSEDDFADIEDAIEEFFDEMPENIAKTLMPKKKIPPLVRRPKNSYMFYCEDQRPVIRKENPNLTMGQIAKLIGASWRSCDEEEKNFYVKLAEEDKERYKEDIENLPDCPEKETLLNKVNKVSPVKKKKNSDDEDRPLKKEPKKSSKKTVKSSPKEKTPVKYRELDIEKVSEKSSPESDRSKTLFAEFSKEKKPILQKKNPNMSKVEIIAELHRMWKNMSEKEKNKYDISFDDDEEEEEDMDDEYDEDNY